MYIKVKILVVILALFLFFPVAVPAGTKEDGREIDAVLAAAETLFVKLQAREYQTVWGLLTEKSQETIVKDTYKSLDKSEVEHSREEISADFSQGGPISEVYWGGYLSTFDPYTVLGQSVWSMGMLKNDRAEIYLRYKNAVKPAVLKMYIEKGQWRVGLVESFWSRKTD